MAFFAALLHTWSAVVHIFGGTLEGVFFLTPDMQIGVALGLGALLLMVPLALTSNNFALKRLGRVWGFLHRAVYGVVVLALLHTLSTGVHYLYVAQTPLTILCTLMLGAVTFWIWQARDRSKA
jgi:DMSO/TMAO reductase YedYZ heme-binding membrane subunit